MPFTFLAHQAPVLPLKMARPKWFDGTALLIGSMSPDFEYLIQIVPRTSFAHNMTGIFYFCIPITLGCTWVFKKFVAQKISSSIPNLGSFHLHDVKYLAQPPQGKVFWLKATISAVIGAFSHIVLDGFTHLNGWFTRQWAWLRMPVFLWNGMSIEVCRLLQYVLTFVFSIFTVWFFYRIGKSRKLKEWSEYSTTSLSTIAPVQSLRSTLWRWVPSIFFIAYALWRLRVVFAKPQYWFADAKLYVWGYVFYIVLSFGIVGFIVGCVVESLLSSKRNQ